jgi:4a-hydroxytetrahydrobiopterin dehydratase
MSMAVLSDEEIRERLTDTDGWERDGDALRKRFKFDDFQGSVDFIGRITPAAEEMNHHPDLAVSWDTVTVSLSTHSEGGITENDFELASKIDSLA